MTRGAFLERVMRQIYGGLWTDDADITLNLVNVWLTDAIATAAKTCYKEAIQLDGVGYVNNGFYSTFSGITISADDTDNLCYKFILPQIPVGIGANMGVAEVRFKDSNSLTSLPGIPVTINQWGYFDSMRPIPNKIIFLPEGGLVRAKTPLILSLYTATVKIISAGDPTDLNSELNVPPDYFPIMTEYLKQQLMAERMVPVDVQNDGLDAIKTT